VKITKLQTLDVSWCGGLTEAKKTASLAEACLVPEPIL
jgi:L-alanine-DL-glutamate epimerase-like enolase superfamily enzyme